MARNRQCAGSHKSTIRREFLRNCGQRGYRPRQAHFLAVPGRYHRRVRIQLETWKMIEDKLQRDWSSEQISGWMGGNQAVCVSREWNYQYILMDKLMGGHLYPHLRFKKKRRKRYESSDRCGQLLNRVSIEQQPQLGPGRIPRVMSNGASGRRSHNHRAYFHTWYSPRLWVSPSERKLSTISNPASAASSASSCSEKWCT
jgi:hypothetical protein